jgi:hypothetical protein
MVKYSLLLIFFLNVAHLWGQQAVELPDSTRRGSLTVKADYRIAELMDTLQKAKRRKADYGLPHAAVQRQQERCLCAEGRFYPSV